MFDFILSIFWYYTLYLILKFVFQCGYFIYRHYIRKPHDLLKRYGENSWALITGATDGIGKGMAIDLAKKGFNIILVSRTQEKLDKVSEEIKRITDFKASVQTVAFDFSEKYLIKDYEEAFGFVRNLDLSILVNNVGWTSFKRFNIYEGKAIQDHVNINVVPQLLLTTMFLKQLTGRSGLKSSIINLASFASTLQSAKFIMYNAVKACSVAHSKIVHYEHSNSLDCIVVRPMWVETPLSQKKVGDDLNIISVDTLNSAVFKQLGHDFDTFGAARHEWQARLASCLPNFITKFKNCGFNNSYDW